MNIFHCCGQIPISHQEAETLILELSKTKTLPRAQLLHLVSYLSSSDQANDCLFTLARTTTEAVFGRNVYIRGLIEFTNYCKNDCYYCGIRRSNGHAARYRLTAKQIIDCCTQGYQAGFRTFVLQGGDDPLLTETWMTDLITEIKTAFPDCALTLSIGERKKSTYQAYYDAGADRYLLRHETADSCHYGTLHPPIMALASRIQCLSDLKDIGFQVGAGFMVGSPFQTTENLVDDLLFLKELEPHMIGIGPFIPHRETPFADHPTGPLSQTLHMLALLRLMHPQALLPATTALGTIHQRGRELGFLAGANVVMPNLSPVQVRGQYTLYNDKLYTGCEAAEGIQALKKQLATVNRAVAVSRGDHLLHRKTSSDKR